MEGTEGRREREIGLVGEEEQKNKNKKERYGRERGIERERRK